MQTEFVLCSACPNLEQQKEKEIRTFKLQLGSCHKLMFSYERTQVLTRISYIYDIGSNDQQGLSEFVTCVVNCFHILSGFDSINVGLHLELPNMYFSPPLLLEKALLKPMYK